MINTTFEDKQRRIQEILQSIESGKISLSEVENLLEEAKSLIDESIEQLTTLEQQLVVWENNKEELPPTHD